MNVTSPSNIAPETLARIIDVGRRLNSTVDMNSLLRQIINEAADLLDCEGVSLLLYDPRRKELRFKATVGEASRQLENQAVPLKGSIAGRIFLNNEAIIVQDVRRTEGWNPKFDAESDFHTRGILGVPLHDGSGQPVGVLEAINKKKGDFDETDVAVLSTFSDLAGAAVSKAQLFDELQQAYFRLNELDRLKSDFIALASHELRTPLSVILGYVSYLREHAKGELVEQLDLTMKAAMRLRSLIQDMVNLQYVNSAEATTQFEPFDLAQIIRAVVVDREETALAKQLTLKLHLPSSPLRLTAEPDMVKLIIDNLVNNAIKFTPAGGRVDVGAALRDEEIWFYVRDTGIGIPVEQLNRIFDRFYQVEPHLKRHYEGLGLGLAIVKELVDLHGGRVWAQSELDKGSEFFVVLPLVPPPPRNTEALRAEPPAK